jgi:hypothetical protein
VNPRLPIGRRAGSTPALSPFVSIVLAAVLFAPRAFAQDDRPPPLPAPASAPPTQVPPPPLPPLVFEANELPDESYIPRPPPPLPEPRRPSIFHLTGGLEGGYARDSLYGTPMNGGALGVYVGGAAPRLTLGVKVDLAYGTTDVGLATLLLTAGLLFEVHLDRVRLGGGVRLGTFDVHRTTIDGWMGGGVLGLYGRASVDLLSFDEARRAVYVVGQASADGMVRVDKFNFDGLGPVLGVTIGAGVRF